jgi:hypothetical protein
MQILGIYGKNTDGPHGSSNLDRLETLIIYSYTKSLSWFRNQGRQAVAIIAFLIAVISQLYLTSSSYTIPTLQHIWQIRNFPARKRAALIRNESLSFYLEFLYKEVPEDGKIIVLPGYVIGPVTNIAFLQ